MQSTLREHNSSRKRNFGVGIIFPDRYFHIPLPIVTKHELGLPFPLGNLPIKFGTNPSTVVLVVVVTGRHTQTDKPTPVKTLSLAFAGITIDDYIVRNAHNTVFGWKGLAIFNRWFLGPTCVLWPTDHATGSVTIDGIYVRVDIVLRCDLINTDKYFRTNQDLVYDYKADLTGTGGLPVCVVMLFQMQAKRILCPSRQIGLESIAFSVSVLHSFCLFASWLTYLTHYVHVQISPTCYLWRESILFWRLYNAMYFRFYGWHHILT